MDGLSAARSAGIPEEKVFKTLVLQGASREYFVCAIPVGKELDLKKAARHFGEKKIEMIPMRDLTKVTGYIKGGCSPIGMKKKFRTAVDQSAEHLETIVVSAGKVGIQMEVPTSGLLAGGGSIAGGSDRLECRSAPYAFNRVLYNSSPWSSTVSSKSKLLL